MVITKTTDESHTNLRREQMSHRRLQTSHRRLQTSDKRVSDYRQVTDDSQETLSKHDGKLSTTGFYVHYVIKS